MGDNCVVSKGANLKMLDAMTIKVRKIKIVHIFDMK